MKSLFKYYNQFIEAEKNGIEVLINDEAHRVKETSTNRWTPAVKRTGRPQVEELIDAARVPVFLLDERQLVRPSERGSMHDIVSAAERMGCEVLEIDLNNQFRCGGSRIYEELGASPAGTRPGRPVRVAGRRGFYARCRRQPR